MFLMQRLNSDPFLTMGRELERAFGHLANGAQEFLRPFPALNVWEEGDKFHAEAELPGFKLEDLEVFVEGDLLSIKGKREVIKKEDHTYLRRERITGEFERSVTLPTEVNSESVEASMRDGVLTVILPKAEKARSRKIAVKTA